MNACTGVYTLSKQEAESPVILETSLHLCSYYQMPCLSLCEESTTSMSKVVLSVPEFRINRSNTDLDI